PEQDALKLIARQGKFANSYFRVGVLLGREECHDGWALKHGARIIRRDVEAEHQFPAEERTLAEGLHSYCAVPLIVRGESIGVVTLLSRRKNQFSERQAEFLQQAADQIVLAIRSFNPHCTQHLKPSCSAPGASLPAEGRRPPPNTRSICPIGGKEAVGARKTELAASKIAISHNNDAPCLNRPTAQSIRQPGWCVPDASVRRAGNRQRRDTAASSLVGAKRVVGRKGLSNSSFNRGRRPCWQKEFSTPAIFVFFTSAIGSSALTLPPL